MFLGFLLPVLSALAAIATQSLNNTDKSLYARVLEAFLTVMVGPLFVLAAHGWETGMWTLGDRSKAPCTHLDRDGIYSHVMIERAII